MVCALAPFTIKFNTRGICADGERVPDRNQLLSKHTKGMPKDQDRVFEYDAADEYHQEPVAPPEIPAWKDGSLRIGIHTSIAGDIVRSLEIASELGANALQIFSASPRMWTRGIGRIAPADAARFRVRRRELQLGPVVIHGNYLINLASPNPVLRARSVQAFHQELVRAIDLGADYLVAHPGSFCDGAVEAGVAAIAQGLKQAARGLKLGELKILLENTAGQGSSIGSKFEELKAILDLCTGLALGVCVDTAHTFAAGWDIQTADGLESALRDIERTVGLGCVSVIHVNDSKAALGSRVDRHEHIGKGKIGAEAFARILRHPLLRGRAFILETPIDKPGDDRRNVAALWRLAGRPIPTTAKTKKATRAEKPEKVARRAVAKRLSVPA
ncbi:MAG: deoxyribonuclease IV [Candidatus Acidiferrales bacterium]